MPNEEQYLQRIQALESRVAELTRQLEAVTRERDEARGHDASSAAAPVSNGVLLDGPSGDVPQPGMACSFCDGEGVYWVHDFEMVCRRCNGTGRVPETAAGPKADPSSL